MPDYFRVIPCAGCGVYYREDELNTGFCYGCGSEIYDPDDEYMNDDYGDYSGFEPNQESDEDDDDTD